MRGICSQAKQSVRIALGILTLAFAGCATNLPNVEPMEPEPVVVIEAPDAIVTPIPDPEPAVEVPAPPSLPAIAIVLTTLFTT